MNSKQTFKKLALARYKRLYAIAYGYPHPTKNPISSKEITKIELDMVNEDTDMLRFYQ